MTAMTRDARWPLSTVSRDVAGHTVYEPGNSTVFCDDGAHHPDLRSIHIPRTQFGFGVHQLGTLCRRCRNTEIERYWQRRFSGVRRQTAAKASNTCKCEAHLRDKTLCFDDRVSKHEEITYASRRNTKGILRWLYRDPNDSDRVKLAVSVPAMAWVLATRGANAALEDNACRCGRAIPKRKVQWGLMDDVPVPVAMCTCCEGVIVDTTHRKVTGRANRQRGLRPKMLPEAELGRLKLNRPVVLA